MAACSPSTELAPAAPVASAAAEPVVAEAAPAATTPPADGAPTDTCNLEWHGGFIGKSITDSGAPVMGNRDWTIGDIRVLGPGEPPPKEFSPRRLIVEVDAAGIITGMRCG